MNPSRGSHENWPLPTNEVLRQHFVSNNTITNASNDGFQQNVGSYMLPNVSSNFVTGPHYLQANARYCLQSTVRPSITATHFMAGSTVESFASGSAHGPQINTYRFSRNPGHCDQQRNLYQCTQSKTSQSFVCQPHNTPQNNLTMDTNCQLAMNVVQSSPSNSLLNKNQSLLHTSQTDRRSNNAGEAHVSSMLLPASASTGTLQPGYTYPPTHVGSVSKNQKKVKIQSLPTIGEHQKTLSSLFEDIKKRPNDIPELNQNIVDCLKTLENEMLTNARENVLNSDTTLIEMAVIVKNVEERLTYAPENAKLVFICKACSSCEDSIFRIAKHVVKTHKTYIAEIMPHIKMCLHEDGRTEDSELCATNGTHFDSVFEVAPEERSTGTRVKQESSHTCLTRQIDNTSDDGKDADLTFLGVSGRQSRESKHVSKDKAPLTKPTELSVGTCLSLLAQQTSLPQLTYTPTTAIFSNDSNPLETRQISESTTSISHSICEIIRNKPQINEEMSAGSCVQQSVRPVISNNWINLSPRQPGRRGLSGSECDNDVSSNNGTGDMQNLNQLSINSAEARHGQPDTPSSCSQALLVSSYPLALSTGSKEVRWNETFHQDPIYSNKDTQREKGAILHDLPEDRYTDSASVSEQTSSQHKSENNRIPIVRIVKLRIEDRMTVDLSVEKTIPGMYLADINVLVDDSRIINDNCSKSDHSPSSVSDLEADEEVNSRKRECEMRVEMYKKKKVGHCLPIAYSENIAKDGYKPPSTDPDKNAYLNESDDCYQCTKCDKEFADTTSGSIHVKKYHLTCSTCKSTFADLGMVDSHSCLKKCQQLTVFKEELSSKQSMEEPSIQNVKVIVGNLQDVECLNNITKLVGKLHGVSEENSLSVDTTEFLKNSDNALSFDEHKEVMKLISKQCEESSNTLKTRTFHVPQAACPIRLVLRKHLVRNRESYVLNWKCHSCALVDCHIRLNNLEEAANHTVKCHESPFLVLYPAVLQDSPCDIFDSMPITSESGTLPNNDGTNQDDPPRDDVPDKSSSEIPSTSHPDGLKGSNPQDMAAEESDASQEESVDKMDASEDNFDCSSEAQIRISSTKLKTMIRKSDIIVLSDDDTQNNVDNYMDIEQDKQICLICCTFTGSLGDVTRHILKEHLMCRNCEHQCYSIESINAHKRSHCDDTTPIVRLSRAKKLITTPKTINIRAEGASPEMQVLIKMKLSKASSDQSQQYKVSHVQLSGDPAIGVVRKSLKQCIWALIHKKTPSSITSQPGSINCQTVVIGKRLALDNQDDIEFFVKWKCLHCPTSEPICLYDDLMTIALHAADVHCGNVLQIRGNVEYEGPTPEVTISDDEED